MVDGRNPAPADKWLIPLLKGFQPSKVQDFFHPQYIKNHQNTDCFIWLHHPSELQYSGNFNSTPQPLPGGPVPRDRALRSWWRSKFRRPPANITHLPPASLIFLWLWTCEPTSLVDVAPKLVQERPIPVTHDVKDGNTGFLRKYPIASIVTTIQNDDWLVTAVEFRWNSSSGSRAIMV